MKFTANQIEQLKTLADRYNVGLAALMAVISVESGGQIYANVSSVPNAPLIRWEGHYLYRLLAGNQRDAAVAAKLASPKAGGIKNPTNQFERYAMLRRAAALFGDDAAYSSISIGVGQVMGIHAVSLGYKSPKAMFQAACGGLGAQVEIMLRFIKRDNLIDELKRKDWSAFARGYNGPAYAKNKYDVKLAAAFAEAEASLPARPSDDLSPAPVKAMLRLGSTGSRVREVQATLVRLGFALNVDGDFGPTTRDAVTTFQARRGIEADGVVGPRTYAELQAVGLAEDPLTVTSTPEAKTGAASAGGGIGLAVVADKLKEIAANISGDETFQTVASALQLAAGAIIVGGLIWAAYGYLRARKTREGLI